MLDIEQRGDAVVIHLRRAPTHESTNALNTALLRRLTAAVAFVGGSRALILTGYRSTFAVDETRCRSGTGTTEAEELLTAQRTALRTLVEHPGPIVAAINGDALDSGFAIAAAADTRIMSRGMIGLTHRAALTSTAHGLVSDAASPFADSMLLDGAAFTPNEAAELGLVDRTTRPCCLLDEAIASAADHERTLSPSLGA